ncbi:MAG: hypothetical protein SF339_07370 [Blastocatellia bacterium]|nr:hypothetical protein [Blastocatellia bacterium]
MKSHESGQLSKLERSSGSAWVDLASMGMQAVREERAEARNQMFWLVKMVLWMGILAAGVLAYEFRGFIEGLRVSRGGQATPAPTKVLEAPELKNALRSAVLRPAMETRSEREEAPVAEEAEPEPPKPEVVFPPVITEEELNAGQVRKRLQALREGENQKPLPVRPEGVW